jgi:cbb3-type cytochrome oxidase maturation protein
MSVMVGLIAAGGLVAAGFLVAFVWAVRGGQFDDTVSPPLRILFDDPVPRVRFPGSEGDLHGHHRS